MSARKLYGCIEAGGTKIVLGTASGPDELTAAHRIETTGPEETIAAVIDWFGAQPPLSAIGLASFGPLDADGASARWGHITQTTKAGWSNTDFAGPLIRALGIPLGFDTDVNAAALAEARWGNAQDSEVCAYVTVGTGIGGGAVVNGSTLHGAGHPEMGHIYAKRHPNDHDFAGVCPFHGDCFEGLASGPAVIARWGASLSELPGDHAGHAIIAWYLGQFAVAIQAVLAPRVIVMGGGVMHTAGLIDRVQRAASDLAGGYLAPRIVSPGLGDRSGLMGALILAQAAEAAIA
jgi:fructokinase